MISHSSLLLVAATSLAHAQFNLGVCYSYGVDYVDEESYFINSASADAFTAVSYFRGCNEDVADVLLVAPEADADGEYLCSQIPTKPDDVNQLSTCPIQKNQMVSGHWMLLVLGNNGDCEGCQPFAWQRDLYLTVGTQVTSTLTPTLTLSMTTTPTETQTMMTTSTDVITTGPFSTVILPSGTAKKVKTVTPRAVTTTSTKLMTKTRISITKDFGIVTKTVTATCTTPGHSGIPDKPCKYSPTKIHPAALVTPTTMPKLHRFMRKGDREVDYEWARARIEAAKERRAAQAAGALQRRAPDAPTTTFTASEIVSVTTTVLAPAITTTESVLLTATSTFTVPPPTVLSGILTQTTTLPTPTKTKLRFDFTTSTRFVTIGAKFTRTTTITPAATLSVCKNNGGHFWRW